MIKNLIRNSTVSEATQSQDPNLTLLTQESEDFVCLFPTIRCKDFFAEVFNKIYTGKDSSIYEFVTKDIDVKELKDSEYFYLLMEANSSYTYTMKDQVLLQDFLDIFNPKSEVVFYDNCLIIKFHRNWTDRPYLLSMFLVLCRIGLIYNGGDYYSFAKWIGENTMYKSHKVSLGTIGQFCQSQRVITDYLEGTVHEQSYTDYVTTSELHNLSGSVSFSQYLKNNNE